MPSVEEAGEVAPLAMGLRVAGLGLWLDARGAGPRLVAPPSYARFVQAQTAGTDEVSAVLGDLVLRVQNGAPPPEASAGLAPICQTKIWELWLDETGRYVFVAPRQSPPRWVVVTPSFTTGDVFGDFSSTDGKGLYPLQGLDNVLITNWLASFGDVILHASGVAVDAKGYCFIGPAGAGKSTLAADLSKTHSATVLGEDQVILRYVQGSFWIYGTPWHLNPQMCSPRGVLLDKLFFLDRTAGHRVAPLSPMDGIARLLQTAFIPYYNHAGVAAILDRLALLAQRVTFYTLGYRLGTDPMTLISEA